MKKEIVLVKYGGSVITDKCTPLSIDFQTIQMMNRQISTLIQKTDTLFVIGNGGGSFGHYFAHRYSLAGSTINDEKVYGVCSGKNGNNYLNQHIVNDLINRGVNACSTRISTVYLPNRKQPNWSELSLYLSANITPVLYGDILLFEPNLCSIVSTEHAFEDLCICLSASAKYRIKKVIMCTDTNGVLDFDGTTIPVLDKSFNELCYVNVHGNRCRYDVTGGMKEKIDRALAISKYCDVQIINGKKDNSIINAYDDDSVGTIIRHNPHL